MGESDRFSDHTVRPKHTGLAEARKVDELVKAQRLGDEKRRNKPGRKPSPRTHQLHPKVFPRVGQAIVAEAERLGITQGQLIEQIWESYETQK